MISGKPQDIDNFLTCLKPGSGVRQRALYGKATYDHLQLVEFQAAKHNHDLNKALL